MLTNIEAVIFDLDGTLIDSIGIWNKIDIDYLSRYGKERPKNLQEKISHLTFRETAQYFQQTFNINETIEKIIGDWHDMALDSYKNKTPLKCGAKEFLEFLHKSKIKIGLATSNSIDLLETTLKAHDIYDLFDAITTTAEVSRNKDFPDVYLLAAKKLNIPAERCLVFEDLPVAILGAKKGGMKVAGVYDDHNKEFWNYIQQISDFSIRDYTELVAYFQIPK